MDRKTKLVLVVVTVAVGAWMWQRSVECGYLSFGERDEQCGGRFRRTGIPRQLIQP